MHIHTVSVLNTASCRLAGGGYVQCKHSFALARCALSLDFPASTRSFMAAEAEAKGGGTSRRGHYYSVARRANRQTDGHVIFSCAKKEVRSSSSQPVNQ